MYNDNKLQLTKLYICHYALASARPRPFMQKKDPAENRNHRQVFLSLANPRKD
ncbi:hypothetical protein PAENIP36_72200 [Paenibacillus sp. P36]